MNSFTFAMSYDYSAPASSSPFAYNNYINNSPCTAIDSYYNSGNISTATPFNYQYRQKDYGFATSFIDAASCSFSTNSSSSSSSHASASSTSPTTSTYDYFRPSNFSSAVSSPSSSAASVFCMHNEPESSPSSYAETVYFSSPNNEQPASPASIASNYTGARHSRKRAPEVDDDQSFTHNPPQQPEESLPQPKNKRPKIAKLDLASQPDCHSSPDAACASFECDMCGAHHASYAKLLMHKHKHHNNGANNQCPLCCKFLIFSFNRPFDVYLNLIELHFFSTVKRFGNRANTMIHLKSHTQEKTYKCSMCVQAFVDSSTLKKHLRTHTGEKPYGCHICGKRFAQSGNLKRHMNMHDKLAASGTEIIATSYPDSKLTESFAFQF